MSASTTASAGDWRIASRNALHRHTRVHRLATAAAAATSRLPGDAGAYGWPQPTVSSVLAASHAAAERLSGSHGEFIGAAAALRVLSPAGIAAVLQAHARLSIRLAV